MSRSTKQRLLLFLIAFCAAVTAAVVTGQFSSPQRWEYSQIAQNILNGRGFVYDYLGTPYHFYGPALYPVLLAGILKLTGGSEGIVLIFQGMLFAATALLVYRTALIFFGRQTALLCCLLVSLHPGNLIYAGKLHSQTLDVFFIALSFYIFSRVKIGWNPWKLAGAGAAAGLTVLSRATLGPFFLLWAAWFLRANRRRAPRAVWAICLIGLTGLAMLTPAIARGVLLYGRLVPLRTDTGVNLWYGNHPGASGTSYTLSPHPIPVIAELPPELSSRIGRMNELEQNREFRETAVSFMRANPVAAFHLFLKKMVYFWWFSPHVGLLYPLKWLRVYAMYYGALLVFSMAGLVISAISPRSSARKGTVLFALAAFSVSCSQAIFYVEGRHRWEIEPLLMMFAAVGLCALWKKLCPRTAG